MKSASVPRHEFLNSAEYLELAQLVGSPRCSSHEEFKALACRVLALCGPMLVVGFLDMQLESIMRDSMYQTPPVIAEGPAGTLIVWVAQSKHPDAWRLRYLEGISSTSLLDTTVNHHAYRWVSGSHPQFRFLSPDRPIETDRFDPDMMLVERERCAIGEEALHIPAGTVVEVEAGAPAVLCEFISPPVFSYQWSFDRNMLRASRISVASLRLGRLQFLLSAARYVLPPDASSQIEPLLRHPDAWVRFCAEEQLRALASTAPAAARTHHARAIATRG